MKLTAFNQEVLITVNTTFIQIISRSEPLSKGVCFPETACNKHVNKTGHKKDFVEGSLIIALFIHTGNTNLAKHSWEVSPIHTHVGDRLRRNQLHASFKRQLPASYWHLVGHSLHVHPNISIISQNLSFFLKNSDLTVKNYVFSHRRDLKIKWAASRGKPALSQASCHQTQKGLSAAG